MALHALADHLVATFAAEEVHRSWRRTISGGCRSSRDTRKARESRAGGRKKYGNGPADAREEGSVQKTERQQGVVKKAVAKKVAARATNASAKLEDRQIPASHTRSAGVQRHLAERQELTR